MDIEKQLRVEHSKKNCQLISDYNGDNSSRFEALISCIINKESIIHQRAATVLGYACEKHPVLIADHIDVLLSCLLNVNYHISVSRNFLRSLQNQTHLLNESQLGELIDYCFESISNNNKPIAIQAFAITIITNSLTRYPELTSEFKIILEDRLPFALPAFKYKAKKALRLISIKRLT